MKLFGLRRNANDEKGFTLLEYAVGGGLLIGFVVLGMNAMGLSFQTMLTNLGAYAEQQVPTPDGN